MIRLSFIGLLLITWQASIAQKTFKAKGQAQVKVETDISMDQTKAMAKDLAIINAIEGVLGTYVEQETDIALRDGDMSFKIRGNTKVRGDWLKTDKETYTEDPVEVKNPNGRGTLTELYVTCKINGLVREIIKPKLAFKSVALNCPQPECRTATYYNNESFYLNFNSPSNGYLSVYIVESDVVYRLLPYSSMTDPYFDAIQVQADKDYIFFSASDNHDYFADFPPSLVDEIEMSTDHDKEDLELYVVFSIDPFSKPILQEGIVLQSGSLPKSLSKVQFDEWITNNRIYNPSFNYNILSLQIVRN